MAPGRIAMRLTALPPGPRACCRHIVGPPYRTILTNRRTYHSYDHPPSPPPFNPDEFAILRAAYAHVPELGFSHGALGVGAKDAGYPDISQTLLPDGPFALVRYHLVSKREELADTSTRLFGDETARKQQPGVGARVQTLTWERLMGNREVVHRWQDALAIMAQPSYVPASLKELGMLADDIWFLAGDTAVDPSWYTKRASLSAIYATTELFMTNDKSADFVDTRQFLQRRIEETRLLGGVLSSVGQWIGFTASAGVNVLRSKGARI